MIVLLFISLYTSRVVLRTLGITDFGIYNAVGGAVAMMGFISGSMAVSIQRFLSYDLGKKDVLRLNTTFNTSVVIHILIAILIIILGESVGLYFVRNYMNFPPERFRAALWVYHFCILSCVCKIIQVPFHALIISFERMEIFAFLSIIEGVLSLLIVYVLTIGTFDKLALYSALLALVSAIVVAIYIWYCRKKIKDIRYRLLWNRACFMRLFGFASWSALGELAWAGTNQGVNVVLNLFFGPAVNAARGIAYQASGAVSRFVQSFQTAVNPQIVKQYASGDLCEMQNLVYRSTCFSFYLLFLFALPLFLRIESVLQLWLGQTTEYMIIFCRLMLINTLLDILSNLLATVAKAYGVIRNYQLIVSAFLFLNLPLSYILLRTGFPPESTFMVYAVISVLLLFVRLVLIKKMVGFEIMLYVKQVIYPIFVHIVLSSILPVCVHFYMPDTLFGLTAVVVASTVSILSVLYLFGLKSNEKELVSRQVVIYAKKLHL